MLRIAIRRVDRGAQLTLHPSTVTARKVDEKSVIHPTLRSAGEPAQLDHEQSRENPHRRAQLAPEAGQQLDRGPGDERSEEHPSELQSLMRTSYAVICFKHKT